MALQQHSQHKVRTKFRFTRNFVLFRRKAPKSREKHQNSFAFFLHSTVDSLAKTAVKFYLSGMLSYSLPFQ